MTSRAKRQQRYDARRRANRTLSARVVAASLRNNRLPGQDRVVPVYRRPGSLRQRAAGFAQAFAARVASKPLSAAAAARREKSAHRHGAVR